MKPAALLLAALLVTAGCAGGDGDTDASGVGATDTTTTSTAAPTTAAPETGCPESVDGEPADAGPYAVGRTAVNYVDPSRRTEPPPASGRPATAGRALPVWVLYPAEGDPAGIYPAEGVARPEAAISDGAAAAPGRFPVVVYSHGVSSTGAERHAALAHWVRAGYVVVAPTFPLSSAGSSDITDLPNQPGDVAFVAETFRSEVQNPDHPLHGRVLTDCLALAGHSLGGATTLAAAFDPCCDELDPSAVIDIAGVAVNLTPGASFTEADPRPVLIVHGAQDATVPLSHSEQAYAELPGPRWLLTFPGGNHNSMFGPPEVEVMTEAVVAFLDAQLKGSSAELDDLPALVDASGIATLQVAPGN